MAIHVKYKANNILKIYKIQKKTINKGSIEFLFVKSKMFFRPRWKQKKSFVNIVQWTGECLHHIHASPH